MIGAARANLAPGLGLQSVAFFLLWSYHFWPAAHAGLERLAQVKENSGYLFAFVASALAGAVLPLCFQSLQRGDHRRIALASLPALLLFWGLRGCLVDGFYQAQSVVWGDNAQPLTLAIKIVCDLGITSPLFWTPSLALMFSWVDSEGRAGEFGKIFADGLGAWYRRDVWPLVRMGWVVWLPALAVIYALPASLQLPTQVIIQCFWALILVVLTDKD
jgi:hypothetical protein